MKTTFSRADVSKILYLSFCDGGLQELYHSSVLIDWDSMPNYANYIDAKARLREANPKNEICYEDVMVEILENGEASTWGNVITFTDTESEENHELTLDSALKTINELPEGQKKDLIKILNEDNYDGWTCFNALQLCLLGDVVFG